MEEEGAKLFGLFFDIMIRSMGKLLNDISFSKDKLI